MIQNERYVRTQVPTTFEHVCSLFPLRQPNSKTRWRSYTHASLHVNAIPNLQRVSSNIQRVIVANVSVDDAVSI